MNLRIIRPLFCFLTIAFLAVIACPQTQGGPEPGAPKNEKPAKPSPTPDPKAPPKPATADQVIETSLFIYGLGGGRAKLDQIRKTSVERGRSVVPAGRGTETISYERTVIRGENTDKDKVRFDQDRPNARYALVSVDGRTFGVYNNTIFTPSDDAVANFLNSIYHGVEAMLRYKENGSKVDLAGREKEMGVEYYLIDVTDTKERKTRFYVSVKTFRVMKLTYSLGGVEYTRKFYNQNYTQGTLVAYRSVLTAGDRVVEETDISSVTFGQKVDEDLFRAE